MEYRKFISEVNRLNYKQKKNRVFELAQAIEDMLADVDPPEFKTYFEAALPIAVASTFLVNENSEISEAEYGLYVELWERYKPDQDLIEKESFQVGKYLKHEAIQAYIDSAKEIVKSLVEAYGEDEFTELCLNFLISASAIDGVVDEKEINHVASILGVEIQAEIDETGNDEERMIMSNFVNIIENYFIPTASSQYELSEFIRAILRSLITLMILGGRSEISRTKYDLFIKMVEKYKGYIDENKVDHRDVPIYHLDGYEPLNSMSQQEAAQALFSIEILKLKNELNDILDEIKDEYKTQELAFLLDEVFEAFLSIENDINEDEKDWLKMLSFSDTSVSREDFKKSLEESFDSILEEKGVYIFKNQGENQFLSSLNISYDELSRESFPNNLLSVMDEKKYLLRLKKFNISPLDTLIGEVDYDSGTYRFKITDPTVVLSGRNKKFKRRSIFKVKEDVDLAAFKAIEMPVKFKDLYHTSVPLSWAKGMKLSDVMGEFANIVGGNRLDTSLYSLHFRSFQRSKLEFMYTANCPYDTDYDEVKLSIEDFEIHEIDNEVYILLTTVIDFTKVKLTDLIFPYKEKDILKQYPGISMRDYLGATLNGEEEFLPLVVDALNLYGILDDHEADSASLLAEAIGRRNVLAVWVLIRLGVDTSLIKAKRHDNMEEIKVSYIDFIAQSGHFELLPLFLYNETDYAYIGGNNRYPLLTAYVKLQEDESDDRLMVLYYFKKLFFNDNEELFAKNMKIVAEELESLSV